MKNYSHGFLAASQNTTVFPLELPLGMLRAAEHAAKTEKTTLTEFLLSCIHCDLERIDDEARHQQQVRDDEECLQRKLRLGKIAIINRKEES